jgi:hypothetical protein
LASYLLREASLSRIGAQSLYRAARIFLGERLFGGAFPPKILANERHAEAIATDSVFLFLKAQFQIKIQRDGESYAMS